MTTRARRAIAWLGALVPIALSTSARAQAPTPSDQMLAQSLFEQARALMEQGRYSEACPKFAESNRLDPGGGTILNLGICHEKEGKLATAYTELATGLAQATKDGRQDREPIARELLAALAPRIPKIAVHVQQDEAGLDVRLDGNSLRKPAWDVPTGVDPGDHVVEATLPGRPTFRRHVIALERQQLVVDVPPFGARSAVLVYSAPEAPAQTRKNPIFYATLGFGTVSLLVGTIATVAWSKAYGDRDANCNEERDYCNSDGLDAASRQKTFALLANVSIAVGTVAMFSLILIPPKLKVGVAPRGNGAVTQATIEF